ATPFFPSPPTQARCRPTLVDGVHPFEASLRNLVGIKAQATAHVTIDTLPPPPIEQGNVTVGPVTGGQVTLTGAPGSVAGGALVTLRNTRTGQRVTVLATATRALTGTLAAQPGDGVTLTVTDAAGPANGADNGTGGGAPQPVLRAHPLDPQVPAPP